MSQDITFEQLLPVEPEEHDRWTDESPVDTSTNPSVAELLAELLPRNIEVQIFNAMLESPPPSTAPAWPPWTTPPRTPTR